MELEELIEKAVRSISAGSKSLGDGADGTVYPVTGGVVLKLHNKEPGYNSSNRKEAEHEFEIGRELYSHKIQVPQYFGIFKPVPVLNHWGVFMERIRGITPDSIFFPLKEAKRQYEEQEELINKLGYKTADSSLWNNTRFSLTKWKLYLYDLVRWKKETF